MRSTAEKKLTVRFPKVTYTLVLKEVLRRKMKNPWDTSSNNSIVIEAIHRMLDTERPADLSTP